MFAGAGAMRPLLLELDWERTAMGPPTRWPQSLRSAVSICLGAKYPIAIYWGPELALIYNEAWSTIPGDKHPWALGRSAREVWPDIWHIVGPEFAQALGGEAAWADDRLLPMRRHGYLEETYFNYNLSPIRGESGAIEGVFNAGLDTTERVLGERRNHLLREVAAALVDATTVADASRIAVDAIAAAPDTVPFAALYLVDREEGELRLAATAALEGGGPAAPLSVPVVRGRAAGRDPWNLLGPLHSRRVGVVEQVVERVGALPSGSWPEPPRMAAVVPVARSMPFDRRIDALLVLGVPPGRPFDRELLAFYEMLAERLAAGFASAQAAENDRERYEIEHRIATTLQQSLIPTSLPAVAGLDIAARYRPAEAGVDVGGDWYDVLPLPDGSVAAVIGDVVGKGVPAAATMGQMRNALRAYLMEGFSPSHALERLNHLTITVEGRTFATVLCLVCDPASGEIRWCRAGHLPLLIAGATATRYLEGSGSPPIGAFEDATFVESSAWLGEGELLLLCTDGLVERRDLAIDEGMARLVEVVRTGPDDVEVMADHVLHEMADGPQRDDVAVVVVRRRPVSGAVGARA